MSVANYLEQLLNNQPVEWKKLGEVGIFQRGTSFQKKHFVDEGFPCIHYGQIYTRYSLSASETVSFVPHDFAIRARKAQTGDLVIATTSENDEDVCKAVVWEGEGNVVVSNDACFYHHSMLPRYVAYFFQTSMFQRQKHNFISGTKVRRVNASDLAKIEIPLPPLSVQQRIVEILDEFTEKNDALKEYLQEELTLRTRQYTYYREQLLDFSADDANVVWKKLGEISEYSKERVEVSALSAATYIGVDNLLQDRKGKKPSEHVPTEGRVTAYKAHDVLIGNIRPYLKKIWQADNAGGASGDVLVIHPTSEDVLPKYLYQVLADDAFFSYNMQHAKGAKMPRGSKDKIMNYLIPLPPLSEQARIVAILDKFDALTSSITEGLPLEIELRQKQYAYYREQLLDFRR